MTNKTGCSEHQTEKSSMGGRDTDIEPSYYIGVDFGREPSRTAIMCRTCGGMITSSSSLREGKFEINHPARCADYDACLDTFIKALEMMKSLKPGTIIFDEASDMPPEMWEHVENKKV